ncbi:MAG: hypothetical protein VB071_14715, partial [Lawsonibacter sp.]|nr:hypothetical protein [Lawsonibacter sp.]
MQRGYNGVKFYTAADLSSGYSLEKSELILREFHSENKLPLLNINYVIELFNIKKFFDHNLRLKRWSDADYEHYKNLTKEFDRIIAIFFSGFNDNNFMERMEEVDNNYLDDVWFLISRFKVYERISEEAFLKILDQSNSHLYSLLKQKDIVCYYGQAIANHMLKSHNSAELLMSQFLEASEKSKETLWFPKELTGKHKEKIILDYIRSEETNPNYLALIAGSQSSSDLPLLDKTRLEARKKYEAYMESFFSEKSGFTYGAQVSFSETQDEEILYTDIDSHKLSVSYSIKWIKNNQDYPTLLNNFIYLFGYVDKFFRSKFISQPAELGVFERLLGIKGKKDYATGIQYNLSHMLFNLQMMGYYQQLSNLKIKLESIFKWFFESYLPVEFKAEDFTFVS